MGKKLKIFMSIFLMFFSSKNMQCMQMTNNIYLFIFAIFYLQFFKPQIVPQTIIIIVGSISTTTPIVVQIQQLLNFTTHFTTHLTTNPYHNHGVNIYYHTNFCCNLKKFQTFYHTFYHTFLPHIITTHFTTNFTTNYYHKPLS